MIIAASSNAAIYILSDWRTCCYNCAKDDELEEEINDKVTNLYTAQIHDQRPNRELVDNYIDVVGPSNFI